MSGRSELFFAAMLLPAMVLPAANTGDEQAVRKVIDDFNAYRRANDAVKIASLFAEDADYLPREERPPIRGRAAIQKQFEAVFKGASGSDRDRVVRTLRFVRPDVAVVRTVADAPTERMVDVFVITKDGGDWKIMSRHTARVELPRHSNAK